MDFPIIDFHTHAFPNAIEKKAIKNLENHYSISISRGGRIEQLFESAAEVNVGLLVVHSTATHPSQVEKGNTWMASIINDKVIGFGTLHPDYPHLREELDRMKRLGLKGLKVHPEFQNFDIDDPRMYSIYRLLDRKFPVLFHLGDERLDHSSPARLAKVLRDFPNILAIGAHLGGYARWDQAWEHLVGKDLYLDTSSTLWRLDAAEAARIIRAHGVERILFGTDYPIASHREELECFLNLPLTMEEKKKIL